MPNRFSTMIFKQSALPEFGCDACQRPLTLSRIEPASRKFDLQTFSCNNCDTRETIVVELDEIRIHNTGWWERPTRPRCPIDLPACRNHSLSHRCH